MKTNPAAPATIDEYISGFPPHIQEILQKMRQIIRAAAPQAQETISYQMPTSPWQATWSILPPTKTISASIPSQPESKPSRMSYLPIKAAKARPSSPWTNPFPTT